VNLKLSPIRLYLNDFAPLTGKRKFMSTFRAFSHFTMHRRGATRTSKCPTVCYVKCEAAFWTFNYMLRLCFHYLLLPTNHPVNEVLKTFREISANLKSKYCNLMVRKVICKR